MTDDTTTTTDRPMTNTGSLAKLPSTAEVDGWEVTSSSLDQPSSEELARRITDDAEPEAEDGDTPPAKPEPVDDDHDDAPSDDDERQDAGAKPAEKPEKPGGKRKLTAAERKGILQAEINALTRQRHEEARRFEAEQQARRQQAEPGRAGASTPPSAVAGEPDAPDWDQYEEAGKTFAEWQKDYAKYLRTTIGEEASQRATRLAEQRIAEDRHRVEQDVARARHDERLSAAKTKYEDFEQVVSTNLDDVPQTPFMAAVVQLHPSGFDVLYHLGQHPAEAKVLSTLTMTRPMMDAVKESADPVRLLSFWANNPDEHQRIAEMDAPRQLMALGRLAERLSSPGAKNGSPGAARVSRATPPIRPLGATRPAGSTARDDDDDLEFGPEYADRERERQIRPRR